MHTAGILLSSMGVSKYFGNTSSGAKYDVSIFCLQFEHSMVLAQG
jgi:hypothetical protein